MELEQNDPMNLQCFECWCWYFQPEQHFLSPDQWLLFQDQQQNYCPQNLHCSVPDTRHADQVQMFGLANLESETKDNVFLMKQALCEQRVKYEGW